MKYAGMPMGMWVLFGGSFRKHLSSVYGYDPETAKAIAEKAKPKYKEIIGRLPEFEKADRFKMNIVNCAMLSSFLLSLPERPTVEKATAYYRASMMTTPMKWFCRMSGKKKFTENCFDQKEIDKYVRGAERSKKRAYPMDWVFDFSYDLSVPEYDVTHRECGVCKIGQQENLTFLTPHMCVMDYPTIEYKGGKLLRTKTLGAGGDCCDFHVVKGA